MADKLPTQDDDVSLYQQKVGLEFEPVFVTVGTCAIKRYVLFASNVIFPVDVFNDISAPVELSTCVNTTIPLAVKPVVCCVEREPLTYDALTPVPLVPDVPPLPDEPFEPDVPELPEVPLVPTPDVPDVPLVPEEPFPPLVPEVPLDPEVPFVPIPEEHSLQEQFK